MLARQCRGNQYRCVIEKEKPFARGIDNFVDGASYASLWLNKIEFVCHNDRGLTCFLDQTRDLFVLRRDTADKIDNQYAQICAPNASFRAHHAEYFDGGRMFAALADAGGVDKDEALA